MAMIEDDLHTTSPRRLPVLRVAAIVGVVAFLAGLVAMALVIRFHGDRIGFRDAPRTAVRADADQDAIPQDSAIPQAVPGATPTTDLDALSAREAALAARLADLEARAASIDRQAQSASGYATRAEGLLIAFAARRALDRGLGLGYIEAQLRERFGATQPRSVATIIEASRNPVTIEDLRLGLSSLAPTLVTGTAGNSWWQGFKHQVSNLVVLHREGTPSPRPSDRMTRARQLLEGGQVEAALAEVGRLPGVGKADNWIDAARRYVEARRALDVIETAAILGQGNRGIDRGLGARQVQTPPAYEVAEPDSAPAPTD